MSQGEEADDNGYKLLVACVFSEEMHLLTVTKESTLNAIVQNLNGKWAEISVSSTRLQYEAPVEEMLVTLASDVDVEHMIRVHALFNKALCKMVATVAGAMQRQGRIESDVHMEVRMNTSGGRKERRVDWSEAITGVGQKFDNAEHFRKVLKSYAIAIKRKFKYVKNEKEKIIVNCTVEGCGWRIYASFHLADQSFGIRKCTLEHTCGIDNLMDRDHPKADARWVASMIRENVRSDLTYKPRTVINEIREQFGVEIKYNKAWTAKEIALKEIHGVDTESFDKLRWLCKAYKETNPGTVAELEIIPDSKKFRRVFICLAACVVGFVKGCRPILFLDGTHIKNKWKGCILTAVSKDANNGLFTVAYAVVDAENDENWEWFCQKLRESIESQSGEIGWDRYTVFSDRHSGLMKAIPAVFPGCGHAICVRHLVDNFRTQVLKKYPKHNKMYWSGVLNKAAYAPTYVEFQEHINAITTSMPLANEFIVNSEPMRWANAVYPGRRWGIVNNNIAESWNAWAKEARCMPPAAMVDAIRKKIMKMMDERREDSQFMSSVLCPEQEKIIRENYLASRSFTVQRSSAFLFEVHDRGKILAVDLHKRTCSCKCWQMVGIPCSHALTCIEKMHQNPYEFTDQYYTVSMYRVAYEGVIYPVPNVGEVVVEDDPAEFVHAPDVRAPPGRRKLKRIPSQVIENGSKCGLCGRRGHNRRTCKEPRVT